MQSIGCGRTRGGQLLAHWRVTMEDQELNQEDPGSDSHMWQHKGLSLYKCSREEGAGPRIFFLQPSTPLLLESPFFLGKCHASILKMCVRVTVKPLLPHSLRAGVGSDIPAPRMVHDLQETATPCVNEWMPEWGTSRLQCSMVRSPLGRNHELWALDVMGLARQHCC